jgi:DNA-binding MarR family transcriptional regulator
MKKKKMPTITKKPELSETQQAVFDYVVTDERASIAEIADALNYSTQTVQAALDVLEALNKISRTPRKARSIRIVEARA